jgi:hypothetical protein
MLLTRADGEGFTFRTTMPGCPAAPVGVGVGFVIGDGKTGGVTLGRFSPTPAA